MKYAVVIEDIATLVFVRLVSVLWWGLLGYSSPAVQLFLALEIHLMSSTIYKLGLTLSVGKCVVAD